MVIIIIIIIIIIPTYLLMCMCDMQPAELDSVKSSPACMETLWKLVEIPFMHQAKCVLKFIKKLPGILLLTLAVQAASSRCLCRSICCVLVASEMTELPRPWLEHTTS